jgi:hypothetical protein
MLAWELAPEQQSRARAYPLTQVARLILVRPTPSEFLNAFRTN